MIPTMNKWLKAIITAAILLVAVLSVTACRTGDTPYDSYDGEGYTVSVKFDANGGTFTTNTSVIVDTFNPSLLTEGEDGRLHLSLLDPSDSNRGAGNYYQAKMSGYFLAGWYTERNAVTDSEGNALDFYGVPVSESGNPPAYTYSGLWSFDSDRYSLDPDKEYTASEPVLTLYAAWVPEFSYNFYTMDGTLIESHTFNPLTESEIALPSWNTATGAMDNNGFPDVTGKTFSAAYLDAAGESEITAATVAHAGVFNPEDTSFENNVMNIYVDYVDGVWYRISTAEQLIRIANPSAHYVIESDIDFEGKSWPMSGNFTGSIIGNGHTISNISSRQSNLTQNAGMFGQLTASAVIENVSFENVTYSVMKGSNTQGACFGLLAGTVAEGATLEGVSISGRILVSPDARIPDNYYFGLVCGLGYGYTGIDFSNITVEPIEDETSRYVVTIVSVDGNDVELSIDRRTAD